MARRCTPLPIAAAAATPPHVEAADALVAIGIAPELVVLTDAGAWTRQDGMHVRLWWHAAAHFDRGGWFCYASLDRWGRIAAQMQGHDAGIVARRATVEARRLWGDRPVEFAPRDQQIAEAEHERRIAALPTPTRSETHG